MEFEKHYELKELAKLWNYSYETVRKWFMFEPGIIEGSKAKPGRRKRGYTSRRIPESVAWRVYNQKLRPA